MKKIFTLTLSIFILLLNFTTFVYANEASEYDESELKAILTEAFDIYVNFYDISPVSSFDTETKFIEVIENPMPEIEDYPYLFAKRIDKYSNWNDFVDILESVFSKEMKEKFIFNALVSEYKGNTYCSEILFHPHSQHFFLEYIGENVNLSLDNSFRIISSTDDKVLAEFKVFDWIDTHDVTIFTVEYTKISDNWRISGGSFFNEKLVNRYNSAPQTGIDTFAYTAVAVVALAAAAVVVKKRRA